MTKFRLHFLALCGLLAFAASAQSQIIYAVNGTNELLTFDSSAPSTILSRTAITGTGGSDILNIDFRPAGGVLFGLSGNNNLYTINVMTGVASFVGATGISGGFDYGFDFNPVPDRIRVVTDSGGNFRVNPADGTFIADGALAYVAGDANNGIAPQIGGAAYTNNRGPSPRTPPPGTELFYIDFNLDILVFSGNPNLGELATRGPLGFDVTGLMGFDISGVTDVAFASLSLDGVLSGLYTLDLTTGQATSVGAIGAGETILDISAIPADTSAIPEPSTYFLVGVGVLAFPLLRRRLLKTA